MPGQFEGAQIAHKQDCTAPVLRGTFWEMLTCFVEYQSGFFIYLGDSCLTTLGRFSMARTGIGRCQTTGLPSIFPWIETVEEQRDFQLSMRRCQSPLIARAGHHTGQCVSGSALVLVSRIPGLRLKDLPCFPGFVPDPVSPVRNRFELGQSISQYRIKSGIHR